MINFQLHNTMAFVAPFAITILLNIGIALALAYVAKKLAPEPEEPTNPDLGGYPLQISMKGGPIPKIYGTTRVAGNVIWAGPAIPCNMDNDSGEWQEADVKDIQDFGGNLKELTYQGYRRSFLIAVCEGPAQVLSAKKGKDAIALTDFTWFDGDGNTGIRALTSEDYGDYPHLACAFFDSYELGMTEAIPNFTFVVNSSAYGYPLLTQTSDQADPGLAHSIPISDIDDLQDMQNDLTGNYYLTNDIDASGYDFVPVGQGHAINTEFSGTFDGCGYTISNLTIDKDYSDGVRGVGLFGAIKSSAKIANVTLSNVIIITDDSGTGALVGWIQSPSDILIQNCHVSGIITVSSSRYLRHIGGLIGSSDGNGVSIYDCTSDVDLNVTLQSGVINGYIGGFVGYAADSTIANCRATGDINVDGDDADGASVGGFVGEASNIVSFTDCSAAGDVTGGENVGGFVGVCGSTNGSFTRCSAIGNVTANASGTSIAGGFIQQSKGTYTNCYAWGDVVANDAAGGFAQYLTETLTNCYSIGSVTATNTGGFLQYGSPTATSCYWDTEASGNATSATGTGKTTNEMKTQSTYSGWDFDDIWYMSAEATDMNPADIIEDIIENTRYGARQSDILNDTVLVASRQYWEDQNIKISVNINQTKSWMDWVDYILLQCGGFRYKSEGKLCIKPFKDESAVFSLNDEDIVQPDAEAEDKPPKINIVPRPYSDTYNRIEVMFTDRDNGYKDGIEPAYDAVDVARSGTIRKKMVQLKGIHSRPLAKKMAWRLLIDNLYRFNTYNFIITFKNLLIENGDVGTLSDGDLLSSEKIRIMNIVEAVNGRGLEVTAIDDYTEHYPDIAFGSQSSLYTEDPTVTLADLSVNFNEDYDSAKLYLCCVPGNSYFNGGYIYRSYDDISYELVGSFGIAGVTGGDSNSEGTISGSLPTHGSMTWSPDEYVLVDIGTVTDLKTSITADEFWHDRYLAKIDDEIIAFKEAEETDTPGVWKISNLRRGLFSTEPVAHSNGESFCTLKTDFTYNFDDLEIGQTLYFKVLAFYGSDIQSTSEVSSFSTTIYGWYQRPAAASLLRLSSDENDGGSGEYSGSSFTLYWNLGSRSSGWNVGGWDVSGGGVPWNNYVEDPELQAVVLKFEQTNGTSIGQREIDVLEQAIITKATDLGGFDDAVIKVVPRRAYESRLENSIEVTAV